MKTGMNMLLWATHVTADHFPIITRLKKIGFDGVEVPIFEGDVDHYKKIRKELDNLGLGCTTVGLMTPEANPIAPDPALRQAAVERFKRLIEWTATLKAELMAGPFHSPLGVFSGTGPTEDEKKRGADVLHLPREFMAKILKVLAARGLVRSARGAHGGYQLARPARDISFLEVIEAVEGPVQLNVCLDHKDRCDVSSSCTMYEIWKAGQDRMLEVYRRTTLAELASPAEPRPVQTVPPSQPVPLPPPPFSRRGRTTRGRSC